MKSGYSTITLTITLSVEGSLGKPGHISTSMAKPNIYRSFCYACGGNQLGLVYYEQLKPTETIAGNYYQRQLMRLSRALKEKRPLYEQRHL